MKKNKIRLFDDPAVESTLTPYLRERETCPAVLVAPGGGYGNLCERAEGEPIARRFNELGFHAFVLEYRIAPHVFPAPLHDAMRAVQMIRQNAGKWGVIPDRIAACGFSAGAHLCAMLGTIADQVEGFNGSGEEYTINGMILSYALLEMSGPFHISQCTTRLLGENPDPAKCRLCSPALQISEKTPPAYIWHTFEDSALAYRSVMDFARAMIERGRSCELHIYPYGDHGMQLGLNTLVESWSGEAADFLKFQWNVRDSNDREIWRDYDYGRQLELSGGKYVKTE